MLRSLGHSSLGNKHEIAIPRPLFQILSAFGTVAEHCLPSIMKTLFAWYERQGVEWTISDYTKGKGDSKGKR